MLPFKSRVKRLCGREVEYFAFRAEVRSQGLPMLRMSRPTDG